MESIKKALKIWGYHPFYHQEDNFYHSKDPYSCFHDTFMMLCFQQERFLEADDSLWKMNPTSVGVAEPYTFEDLKMMTDNFSTKCLIKKTMHGKLFRGSMHDREVTIKTWDFFYPCQPCYVDHPSRFCNEIELLSTDDEKPHSRLMKIKGFCFNHILAIVYDEKPANFLSDNKDLGWYWRMKVATQLASLFVWLHERKFLFGCVDSSTIMIDEEFNIKVFDFGFLTHISGENDRVPAYYPLCWDDAPEIANGIRTFKSDVYTFGLLLVELIFQKENVSRQLNGRVFKGVGIRLILDKSLQLQVDDEQATCITELVTACLQQDANARPAMKDVFASLSYLGQ